MRLLLVTPAAPASRLGNRVTALRWARVLRSLGHSVALAQAYEGQECDVLVALHAGRSAGSVARFRGDHPRRPIVLALTGTDVYDWIHRLAEARRSLELADRLIVLQPEAIRELPEGLRDRTRVIYQSASAPPDGPAAREDDDAFLVCQLAHLREVKDPLLVARAARRLPPDSRVRIVHVGAPLDPALADRAREEAAANARYVWEGPRSRSESLRLLARSQALVLASRMEGGANVVSEAVVAGVPVLASRIAGSVGLLGPDYAAYFPPGDERALGRLLRRVETDRAFYDDVRAHLDSLRPLFDPERERDRWRNLLAELQAPATGPSSAERGAFSSS